MASENGSIADEAGEETIAAAELFPLGSIDGDAKTLKTLVRAGLPVTQTVKMKGAEVPVRQGGLLDPDREVLLLVTAEVEHYKPVPQREGDKYEGKQVVGWKIANVVRPIHIENVDGEPGALRAGFGALLEHDEDTAYALLEEFKGAAAKRAAGGRHPARVPAEA